MKEERSLENEIPSDKFWKILRDSLTEVQKKEYIKEHRKRIGTINVQYIKNDLQWKIAEKQLDIILSKPKYHKILLDIHKKNIFQKNEEEVLINKVRELNIDQLSELIAKKGLIHVLIPLYSANCIEKLNSILINEAFNMPEKQAKQEDQQENILRNTLKSLTKRNHDLSSTILNLKKKAQLSIKNHNETIRKKDEKIKEINTLYKKSLSENDKLIKSLERLKEDFDKLNEKINQKDEVIGKLEERINSKDEKVHLNLTQSKNIDISKKQNKILVFGDIPNSLINKLECEFTIFNGDYFNYSFIDDFDEYWLVEDKLSEKEKAYLYRNRTFKTIKWKYIKYRELLII